jgi:hypothetical protein
VVSLCGGKSAIVANNEALGLIEQAITTMVRGEDRGANDSAAISIIENRLPWAGRAQKLLLPQQEGF